MKPLDQVLQTVSALSDAMEPLTFGAPVTHVYNPLRYARTLNQAYLRLQGAKPGRALLLGMNPGPWGMGQTGVPFGEVGFVRDWMGLRGEVEPPSNEHPKRPVQGLSCPRSEVSGRRLWGWASNRYKTPENFFASFAVWNYCPLAFLEATGRNRTPDKLPVREREPLMRHCDAALASLVELLEPSMVVGVGVWAEACAKRVVGERVPVGRVLHPSPASPAANRGWEEAAERQLAALGLLS